MARKNRVSVYDGIYHVTARVASRAMLLAKEEIKDRIMDWIFSVADFSGVEVWSFAIMDNHLHLFVHVPPVPERFWLDPSDEPTAYAFGMRPPECREPLWSPAGDCPPIPTPSSVGDCPPIPSSTPSSAGDCPRRPALGFMLDDGEMLSRLACLYGPERAKAIGRSWESLRAHGCGGVVDEMKEKYCRRMYNLSQFVKTLKERISMWYNDEYQHAGALWEGRFYSGVVEKNAVVKAVVAAYVGYNPVKAGIAPDPASWRWSSYALAVTDEGATGERCRKMYEAMLGRPWEEVRATLESMYADKLPNSITPEKLKEWYDDYDEESGDGRGPDKENGKQSPGGIYRASQAIRASMKFFSGAYIGRDMAFLRRVMSFLPERFPRAGKRSINRCRAFVWEIPDLLRSAA